MLRGVKFDHIACGVRSIRRCYPFVRKLNGFPRKGGDDILFRGGQWKFANNSVLELIEPTNTSPDNFLNKFLHKRAIHHVTFVVPSLAEAIENAKKLELAVVGISDRKPHWKECFLHPKNGLDVLVQLAEVNEELQAQQGWTKNWSEFGEFNKIREEQTFPIHGIKGLRLQTTRVQLDVAQKVFKDLLGAADSSSSLGVLYRWNGSSMHIHIAADEKAPLIEVVGSDTSCLGQEFFDSDIGAKFVVTEIA